MGEESKASMKLLVDTRGNRVLFAEASKDCIDFLFCILSLPVSTLINLIGKQAMVGSLANLYDSVETLNASYFQPTVSKANLLEPSAPASAYSVPLLSLKEKPVPAGKKFYRCSGDNNGYGGTNICVYVSDDSRSVCPSSRKPMCTELTYVAPPSGVRRASGGMEGGLVKGVVTYMVMDDLVVTPMSTISSIALLNKFNVKDVGTLEERVVTFGMDEGMKLLRASLRSRKVLTDVFINGVN